MNAKPRTINPAQVSSIILVTAEQVAREHVLEPAVRRNLMHAINTTVIANPPKPTNPRATVKLVIDEMAAAGFEAWVIDKAQKLFDKNVKRSSPVYAALVTPQPPTLQTLDALLPLPAHLPPPPPVPALRAPPSHLPSHPRALLLLPPSH